MPDPRQYNREDVIKQHISSAVGSDAAFMAARHDPKLQGTFTISHKGQLYHNGVLVDHAMISDFMVYLSGTYGVRPRADEVVAGFTSAATKNPKSIMRKRKRTTHVPPRLLHEVDQTVRLMRGELTTKKIALKLMPHEYEDSARSVEMLISEAMKRLGYIKKRKMINCVRQSRWEPNPKAKRVGLPQNDRLEGGEE
tara:strand:+ start:2321 stop:2908 length:588 start_codon:yes stop_codon:yes gene_type:complete